MNPFKEFFIEVENKVLQHQSDVISLLKADHRKVDQLFSEFASTEDNAEKKRLLDAIIIELRVHSTAEENEVYTVLDKLDHPGTNESFEEHHLIAFMLDELSVMTKMNDKVEAKVKVLSEVVKHHVNEEESKYLPELRNSDADLELLGIAFLAEKDRLFHQPKKTKTSSLKAVPDKKVAKVMKVTSTKKSASVKKTAPAKKAAAVKKTVVAKKAAATKRTAIEKKAVATKKPATAKKAAVKKPIVKKVTAAKKSSPPKKPTTSTRPAKDAPVKLPAKSPKRKAS